MNNESGDSTLIIHINHDKKFGFYDLVDDNGIWLGSYASFEDAKMARADMEQVSKIITTMNSQITERLDDALNRGMNGQTRSLDWLEGYCAAATIARTTISGGEG
jgi:hypothetical protein